MLMQPDIDPVAFSICPLAVRWYGLMYLAGFASGWWLGARRIARGIAQDFRMAFGSEPPSVIEAVAPFTGNDQTREAVVAYYGAMKASAT